MSCKEFIDRYGADGLFDKSVNFSMGENNWCGDIVAFLGSENSVLVAVNLEKVDYIEIPLEEAFVA